VIRFYLSQYPQENAVIESLYEGCPEEKQLVEKFHYKPSDVAVVMGVFKRKVQASWPRGSVIRAQGYNGLDCLILETGYVNRGSRLTNHYALGWNGLNRRADFCNRNSPPDRSEKLAVTLKPWKDGGDYILLCGQVPWDASVDFTDHVQWLRDIAVAIKAVSRIPLRFRPHPLGGPIVDVAAELSQGTLQDDLSHAKCVVNFNSNTGVDAVLAGVPTIVFDIGSMVWDHKLTDFENLPKPDRQQWIQDLCYAQWTPQEMRSGEAWAHVSKRLFSKRLSTAG
jgi:hypothetical protein